MNFKPNEFFIGLVDFVTILLPGALLSVVALAWQAQFSTDPLYRFALDEKTSLLFGIAFLFASFGVGYFLSSIASGLDQVYDNIRKQIYPYEEHIIERIKKQKAAAIEAEKCTDSEKEQRLESLKKEQIDPKSIKETAEIHCKKRWRRALLLFFELEHEIKIDQSFGLAKALFEEKAGPAEDGTNVYKWSQAMLDTWFPAVADQINRSMAASKFFRSLTVVAVILLALQVFGLFAAKPFGTFGPTLLLLILSFREYIVQRNKSTTAAYRSVVSLFYAPQQFKIGR